MRDMGCSVSLSHEAKAEEVTDSSGVEVLVPGPMTCRALLQTVGFHGFKPFHFVVFEALFDYIYLTSFKRKYHAAEF